MPKFVIIDGDSNFCNMTLLMKVFFHMYNMTHKVSTPYFPQSNGQEEVSNTEIKQVLENTLASTQKDWIQ